MRRLKVEIVPGAVQVHRQKINCIHAVLLAVCSALHEQGFLSDSVRSVGLFGVPVPKVILVEWCWGVFRVCANGPEHHHLLRPIAARGFDHVDAHKSVFVEERSGAVSICPDPSNHCGAVHQHFRASGLKHSCDAIRQCEIVLGVARHEDIAASDAAELFNHVGAQEAGTAGNGYPAIGKIEHVNVP